MGQEWGLWGVNGIYGAAVGSVGQEWDLWGCCRGLHGLARTSQDCPAHLAYLTCPAHLKGQAKACCARPFDRP